MKDPLMNVLNKFTNGEYARCKPNSNNDKEVVSAQELIDNILTNHNKFFNNDDSFETLNKELG